MWASCVIRNLYRTHRSLFTTSTTIYLASIIGLYTSFLTQNHWLFVSLHTVKVNGTKFEVLVARNVGEPARKRNGWTRLTFLSSLVITSLEGPLSDFCVLIWKRGLACLIYQTLLIFFFLYLIKSVRHQYLFRAIFFSTVNVRASRAFFCSFNKFILLRYLPKFAFSVLARTSQKYLKNSHNVTYSTANFSERISQC